MRKYISFNIATELGFSERLLSWGRERQPLAFYNSHNYADKYKSYDFLLGCGAIDAVEISQAENFAALDSFFSKNDWCFGYISYDVKNFFEQLSSQHYDGIALPLIHFFCPSLVFICRGHTLEIGYAESVYTEKDIADIFHDIKNAPALKPPNAVSIDIEKRIAHDAYIKAIRRIKEHIQLGDIYEMNFCMEFFAKGVPALDATEIYHALNSISPAPFSCLYSLKDKALVSSSPERFLKKKGSHLISQPIKGTSRRGTDAAEDKKLAEALLNSEKERSENIMIVDLVRNDLSRLAQKQSVVVEELCGLYSFPTVHQLISTIAAREKPGTSFCDILKATFPPGSMTGAPKVRAMEIIETYEKSKRGVYAGAVGYKEPGGDFDFSVVIRSILLNNAAGYVSFHVGGAITALSEPESEYRECLLKAKALLGIFKKPL